MIPPIDLKKFTDTFHAMLHVKYRLGAKCSLSAKPNEIREIDCSGFARLILSRATDGKLVIPDGSWNQREWCEKAGLRKLKKYSDVQYAAKDPKRLFICFVKPVVIGKVVVKAGHVWFVSCGVTIESRGGAGVSSRYWNQAFARLRGAVAFELETK